VSTDLPRNWCDMTIGEVFTVTLGQSPPSSTYNSHGEGLPFFQGKAEFGDVYPVARKWCGSPKKIAQKGDVLLTVRAPVGPTNIAPTKCCIGRGLASIRPVDGIDTKFILYFFRSVERYLAKSGTGTTFNAITGDKLKGLPIPIPPLPEQYRIVAKIEELFTKLDAGVDALKQVQAQLKRYRQSVLKAAVEGKLTAEWREQHHLDELEPADKLLDRIQSERKAKLGEKYKEPAPINTTNLPYLPKGWVWTNVDSAFDITLGQSPPSSTYNKNGEGLPFFQGKAEFGNIYPTKNKWCNSPKKIAQKGSILISVRAPVGPTNIAPDTCCIGRGLAAIKGLGGVHTKFILYTFRAFEHKFSSKGTGTTFKAITGDQLKKVIIPFPPLIEQNNIVMQIEQILSNIEGAETVLEPELKRAHSLRQSILKHAFEGKLVPQDPNDEPASVLLERIKEEKAKPNKSKQLEII